MNHQALIIMVSITLVVGIIVYLSWVKATQKKINPSLIIIPAIIVLTTVGYVVLGNPPATDPSERFANNGNVGQFVNAVESLEKKAAAEPNNLEHQIMLAHSYRAMGKYDQSIAAFGKSWEKIKNNSDELTLFAGTLAVWRGEFKGKPDELLDMALALNPNNIDALMLAGGSAFQKQNYAEAITIWKKIPVDKLEEEDKQWVQQHIQDTQAIINKQQAETE